MYDLEPTGHHSDGDMDVNPSNNPTFGEVLESRNSRRQILGGMTAVAALFGVSACSDDGIDGTEVTVSAGAVAATTAGKVVTLTGSATGTTAVMWSQVSGPAVTLTNANSSTATFLAPSVASSTPLVFRFSATGQSQGTVSQDTTVTVGPAVLGFTAVAKNLADIVTVPTGYTVTVLYRLGDPIAAGVPAYANNGTDTNFAQRAGDHHDGMYYYGLAAAAAARDDDNSTRGLLVLNHENITETYLHVNGITLVNGGRPEAEAIKEIECHGVSIIEVLRGATGWNYVQNSTFNHRVTPNTATEMAGPVRGDAAMRTAFSPTGVGGRGTINNCAHGINAWGTYLTCEENWASYFRRPTSDNVNRTAKQATLLARYGVTSTTGAYGWSSVAPSMAGDTRFAKWNATATAGLPADGSGDFRNEPNQYGWVVEMDPYNASAPIRKRTALGRMGHEGAWPSNFVVGQRPAFYMGDDSRNEYFYKFVSATPWVAADAQAGDRMAIGDKYLNAGTLYVARFDATGQGVWLPLVFGQGALTAAYAPYPFTSQPDVLLNTRGAADAVGATRMDRPEWAAVNPMNGEVYLTLTNTGASQRPLSATDAANPRHYDDPRGAAQTANHGNPNGHIIRLRETGNTAEATTFAWDNYLFGAGADLNAANINLSSLDATNDFSSPDGLWFARPSNAAGRVNPLLWIQTDDGAFTDVTNNQMLAAMPGSVGDGVTRTITNTDATGAARQQATPVGRAPGMQLRRFLVGPNGCEITGVDTTPDGRTMFVNIQHPGENVGATVPATFQSNWPASQSSATAVSRPRSATVVITKDDGGVIAL